MYPFVGSLNTFCVISPIPDVKHSILAMDIFFIEPNWPIKETFCINMYKSKSMLILPEL